MLTRVYIDNYRCFVNFTFQPQAKQLVLGLNGTGKTEFLKVLGVLRNFVGGDQKVNQLFIPEALTRWQNLSRQAFELEVAGKDGVYRYTLWVDVQEKRAKTRVVKEALEFNSEPLVLFEGEQVSLFDDHHAKTMSYPFEPDRSVLSTLRSGAKLRWFKEWLEKLYCIRINPALMATEEDLGGDSLEDDLSNFAAWYSNLTQEHPVEIEKLRRSLQEVLDGFISLNLPRISSRRRLLQANFEWDAEGASKPRGFPLAFDELSEGQRALIALYTLLHFAASDGNTICVDEPDNFVALAEIQPWLFELGDRIEDHGGQAILVSHHPELINLLAPEYAVIFSREHGGPVRVEPFRAEALGKLSPAELIARGWERG